VCATDKRLNKGNILINKKGVDLHPSDDFSGIIILFHFNNFYLLTGKRNCECKYFGVDKIEESLRIRQENFNSRYCWSNIFYIT